MRRFIILAVLVVVLIGFLIWMKRSIPFNDSDRLLSATISLDSIWTLGPALAIYDKGSDKYYWLKSMTSTTTPNLNALKSKEVSIRYMKFLTGPFENRIFYISVDSNVVFNQVIK